jgi:small redox-active disulfide protein 2
MKIEIFGTGCPKCRKLEDNARQAVREMGIEAEIVKVTELKEIIQRGVVLTPALALNGEIKSMGNVLGPDEIKMLLK